MDQVFPTLYRECVSVAKQEQVIGYIHDLFVHMVRDDDSFCSFVGLDESLKRTKIFCGLMPPMMHLNKHDLPHPFLPSTPVTLPV